jgi:hypothetical protein
LWLLRKPDLVKSKPIMKAASLDQELESLKTILHALEPLDETQRRFVLRTVAERAGISGVIPQNAPPNTAANPSHQAHQGGIIIPPVSLDGMSAKDFLKAKRPATDVQRIACLAFYLTHVRKQPHFKTRDLTNLNIEGAGGKMSNAAFTTKNATNQNGFLAHAGKGRKQITGLGEDVVNALPDQEAVKRVITDSKSFVRKKRRPNTPKGKTG